MFKYQHILEAMAERGKVSETPWDVIQYNCAPSKLWNNLNTFPILDGKVNYRIKPKTININGHEVPEPLRSYPEKGGKFYYVSLTGTDLISSFDWTGDSFDLSIFKTGIAHATKEAAIAHAKALLSFTEQKND